jgi:hypothetical protein
MYDEVNSTLISIDVQSDLVVVANNLIYKDVADMWVREGLTYRWVNVQPGFEILKPFGHNSLLNQKDRDYYLIQILYSLLKHNKKGKIKAGIKVHRLITIISRNYNSFIC